MCETICPVWTQLRAFDLQGNPSLLRPHHLKSRAGRRGSSGLPEQRADQTSVHSVRHGSEKMQQCRGSQCSVVAEGVLAGQEVWPVSARFGLCLNQVHVCWLRSTLVLVTCLYVLGNFMLRLHDSVQGERGLRGLVGCGIPKVEIPMSSVWNMAAP